MLLHDHAMGSSAWYLAWAAAKPFAKNKLTWRQLHAEIANQGWQDFAISLTAVALRSAPPLPGAGSVL